MNKWNWLEDIAAILLLVVLVATLVVSAGTSTIGLAVFRIGVLFTALVTTLAYGLSGRWNRPSWILVLALSLYTGVALLSAIKIASYSAWQEMFNIGCYSIAFLISAHLFADPRRKQWFLWTLAILILGMAVNGIFQIFGHEYTARAASGHPRMISSFYFNQAHYGGFLAISTPLAWAMVLYNLRWHIKVFWFLLCSLLVINLLFTSSWDAFPVTFMGIVVAAAVWAIGQRNYGYLALTLLIAVALPLSIAWFTLNKPSLVEQAIGTSPSKLLAYLDYRIHDRLLIYKTAYQSFTESPWIGVGPGQFIFHATLYRPPTGVVYHNLHGFINYTHNDYLQVLSETGALGFVGWLVFMLAALLSKSMAPASWSVGIGAGTFALMLHGFTDANLTVISGTVLLVGCLLGLRCAPKLPQKSI